MLEKDVADNWKPSKKKSREKIDGIRVSRCGGGERPVVTDLYADAI
jgi:hypothetical protein